MRSFDNQWEHKKFVIQLPIELDTRRGQYKLSIGYHRITDKSLFLSIEIKKLYTTLRLTAILF